MNLLTYEIEAREMKADDSLLVQSTWCVPNLVDGDYRETVCLIDANGLLWSPKTAVYPRWYRQPTTTNFWAHEQFADSQLFIEPIAGTPPGSFVLFNGDTLTPVPLADGQTTLDLGTVQITRPDEPAELEPQYPLNQSWDDVTLIGTSLDRETATPGDPFLLSLFWAIKELDFGQLYAINCIEYDSVLD